MLHSQEPFQTCKSKCILQANWQCVKPFCSSSLHAKEPLAGLSLPGSPCFSALNWSHWDTVWAGLTGTQSELISLGHSLSWSLQDTVWAGLTGTQSELVSPRQSLLHWAMELKSFLDVRKIHEYIYDLRVFKTGNLKKWLMVEGGYNWRL